MKPTLATIIKQVVKDKLKSDEKRDAETFAAKMQTAQEVVQTTLHRSRRVFNHIEHSEEGTAFRNGVSDALVIVATIPDLLQVSQTYTPVATLVQLGEKTRRDLVKKVEDIFPWTDSDEPEAKDVAYYNGVKHVQEIFEGVWFGE